MKRKFAENNVWSSLSDVMTGLMVIFMFISIAYMVKTEEQSKKLEERQKELADLLAREQLKKQKQEFVFKNFRDMKENIYKALDSTFRNDFKLWQVELDRNLVIKFTNPDILFGSGEAGLQPKFKEILENFTPRYLGIILRPEYQKHIQEIRIEGHTDPRPLRRQIEDLEYGADGDYMNNIGLSQARARNVLAYIRQHQAYQNLDKNQQELLQFWITANGLSYGRSLDANNQFSFESKEQVDEQKSRRVEFKIVTNSEELVRDVLKNL